MTAQLPIYALYGEPGHSMGMDRLHCESVAERSSLHEWEIRPHRHEALLQILYIRRGQAELQAEGRTGTLQGPCVVTLPSLTAHGFRFSPEVDGIVLTVIEQHLSELLAHEPVLRAAVLRLRMEPVPAGQVAAIDAAATALREEFRATSPWRTLAIDAALVRLVIAMARSLPGEADALSPAGGGRALEHVRRFRDLLEHRYREQPSMSVCAQALGITPTQLNRVCQRVLGQPALAVLHQRLVLEAQRELAYTTMSVKQISLGLGFADAGYFTRFFQRCTGRTPTDWRGVAVNAQRVRATG